MAIIKRPAKKALWGLGLVFGLFLALFVKAFGVASEDKSGFSRVSLLELMRTPQAHADVPAANPGRSNDGDSSGK